MAKLVIPGRLPGLNEYIAAERGNRQAAAKLKRETEQRIMWAARSQLRGVRFSDQVIMHYTWYEQNRKRDKDNIAFAKKFVQDALVKCHVLKNDGWQEIATFTDSFCVDAKTPRVEVLIEEIPQSVLQATWKLIGGGNQ